MEGGRLKSPHVDGFLSSPGPEVPPRRVCTAWVYQYTRAPCAILAALSGTKLGCGAMSLPATAFRTAIGCTNRRMSDS